MNQLEQLETTIEDLKKQINFLMKSSTINNNDTGGNEGQQPQTPPTTSEWTTLYKKDDPSPDINLGLIDGIFSNTPAITNFPDLKDFKHLNICWNCGNNSSWHYFNIEKEEFNQYRFFITTSTFTQFMGGTFNIKILDNKRIIEFATFMKLNIYTTNRFPKVESLKGNKSYFISEIRGKK